MRYGFVAYGAGRARPGRCAGSIGAATPLLAVLGSSRLEHVLLQSEVETFAVDADGVVAWRAAHSDVVAGAELVGGRLVLTSFDGQVRALDPATGQSAG